MSYLLYLFYIFYANFLMLPLFAQSQCFTPTIEKTLNFYFGGQTVIAKDSPILQFTCDDKNDCKYSTDVKTLECFHNGIDNVYCQSKSHLNLKSEKIFILCQNCTTFSNQQISTKICGLYDNLNYNNETANNKNKLYFLLKFYIILFFCAAIFTVIIVFCIKYQKIINEKYTGLPLTDNSFREIEIPIKSNVLYSNSHKINYQNYQTLNTQLINESSKNKKPIKI